MKWLGRITSSMDTNLSRFQEIVEDRAAWLAGHKELDTAQQLNDNNTWSVGPGNTVFFIVFGLTEHKGHFVLMIIKQYLLTTKPLMTEM